MRNSIDTDVAPRLERPFVVAVANGRPPLCSSDRIGRPESEKSLGSLSAITKLTIIPTHRLGISRRQSLQTRGSDHCSPRCAVVERPQSWLPGWGWSSALGTNFAFLFKQRGAVLAPRV